MNETKEHRSEQLSVEPEVAVVGKQVVDVIELGDESSAATDAMEKMEEEDDLYYAYKEHEYTDILEWIQSAEEELADLKLRKLLIEADFASLLAGYNQFIMEESPISAIARTSLLEYFTYELLKPLKTIDLTKAEAFDTWKTKHFLVSYQVNAAQSLTLNFQMNVIDNRFESSLLPLIQLDTKQMIVEVSEKDVLELIRLWHVEKIFSRNQLSLINYDLNLLLSHFKALGFQVKSNFLDNSMALDLTLTSQVTVNEAIIDQIFITAMENESYDFEKKSAKEYCVWLTQEQSVTFLLEPTNTVLQIDSNARKRSILDFFTHYPFLVPLIVSAS